MNDLDQLVRERLRHDAESYLRRRGPAAIPRPIRSRIRRGRTVLLSAVIVLAAAVAGGAVALTYAISGRTNADERPGTTGPVEMRRVTELDEAPAIAVDRFAWPGLWPEVTEPAARAAQEQAEPGSELEWRLSAKRTAVAYAREVFGWTEVVAVGEDLEVGEGQRLRVQCPECGGAPSAQIIVERLGALGGWVGDSPIWLVTGLSVPTTEQGDYLAYVAVQDLVERRASALVSAFLTHRVTASGGAETFLEPEAAAAYEQHVGGLYLYGAQTDDPDAPGHPEGHPTLAYGGFDIISEPRTLVDGTLEAFVSLKVFDADEYDPAVGPSDGQPEILRIAPVDGMLRIISVQRR